MTIESSLEIEEPTTLALAVFDRQKAKGSDKVHFNLRHNGLTVHVKTTVDLYCSNANETVETSSPRRSSGVAYFHCHEALLHAHEQHISHLNPTIPTFLSRTPFQASPPPSMSWITNTTNTLNLETPRPPPPSSPFKFPPFALNIRLLVRMWPKPKMFHSLSRILRSPQHNAVTSRGRPQRQLINRQALSTSLFDPGACRGGEA